MRSCTAKIILDLGFARPACIAMLEHGRGAGRGKHSRLGLSTEGLSTAELSTDSVLAKPVASRCLKQNLLRSLLVVINSLLWRCHARRVASRGVFESSDSTVSERALRRLGLLEITFRKHIREHAKCLSLLKRSDSISASSCLKCPRNVRSNRAASHLRDNGALRDTTNAHGRTDGRTAAYMTSLMACQSVLAV